MHPTAANPSSFSAGSDLCPTADVLPLIEFVEQQLAQIRDAQGQHERHLADAQRQAAMLDGREQELRQAWAALEERQRFLQANAIEIERRAASVAAAESVSGFDRMAMLQHCRSLEDALERAAAEQRSIEAEAQSLRDASGRFAAERTRHEQELEALRRRRDELEGSIAGLRRDLDGERGRTAAAERERQRIAAELADAKAGLAKADAASREASARLAAAESEVAERRRAEQTLTGTIEALRGRIRDRESASSEAAAQAAAQLAAAERELAAMKASLAEGRSSLERASRLEGELAGLRENQRKQVEALESSLTQANARLAEETRLRQALEQQAAVATSTAARERSELAAAATRVERAENAAAGLRRELAQSRQEASEAQSRIRTLQRQLDAAAGESGGDALEDRIKSLEETLAARNDAAETLETRLAEADAALAAAKSNQSRLEQELGEAREQAASERTERQRLAESIADRENAPAAPAPAGLAALKAEIAVLTSRLAESEAKAVDLARRLEERRSLPSSEPGVVDTAALQERVRQLAKIAALLRHRRDRLQKVRAALAIRRRGAMERGDAAAAASPAGGAVLAELRQLQVKQEEFRRARKHLAECETRMIRRWSVHRGAGYGMLVTLFVAALCVGSWMAADLAWPSPGTASVDLMARTAKGQVLAGPSALAWREWHEAQLKDPTVLGKVASRLAARGLSPSDPAALAAMLDKGLRLDSDGPGRLRLVLAGDDRRSLSPILDTLATTLASESLAAAPTRPDAAPAIVLGDRTRDGRVAYSLLDPRPLETRQFARAGIVAGGAMIFASGVGFVATLMLRRSRRVLAEPEVEPTAE